MNPADNFPFQSSALGSEDRPIADVVARIRKLNSGLCHFWSRADGWAPQSAAELMSKSRLDRQVSLSRSLRLWTDSPPQDLEDGDLILGWANLGSLIEGSVKLFLSVFYEDYKRDLGTLKQTQAWHSRKAKLLEPDGLAFDVLIDYAEKAELFDKDDLALFRLVQMRRNAIHAYKDRSIGTGVELHTAIKSYLICLRAINRRLPYPDENARPMEA